VATVYGTFSTADIPAGVSPSVSASVSSYNMTGGTCTVGLNPGQPATIQAQSVKRDGWNVIVPININTTALNPPTSLTVSVLVAATWGDR
jgi:hypothetical protein